jgi:phage FluMu gp28-like protein
LYGTTNLSQKAKAIVIKEHGIGIKEAHNQVDQNKETRSELCVHRQLIFNKIAERMLWRCMNVGRKVRYSQVEKWNLMPILTN